MLVVYKKQVYEMPCYHIIIHQVQLGTCPPCRTVCSFIPYVIASSNSVKMAQTSPSMRVRARQPQ